MPTRTGIILGWLVLFGASLVLFVGVWLLAWSQRSAQRLEQQDRRRLEQQGGRQRSGRRRGQRSRWRSRRASVDPEHEEWLAHAAAVARRAAEVSVRAAAARDHAHQLGRDRETAWTALESAHDAYERARSAFQEAGQRRDAQTRDLAARREVANAALAAYRRGDLSPDELERVWQWGNGWDPDLERRERAYLRARAHWREAQTRYQVTAGVARAADAAADLADAEARVLIEELEYTAAYLEDAGFSGTEALSAESEP